jgi:hypothetical protein
MSEPPVLDIDHVPPMIRVRTLINGRLPPAIFLAVPKAAKQRTQVEEFIHMDILPVDLQVNIRREVRFVVYQRLAEDLARLRKTFGEHAEGQSHIIIQMDAVWPTLSDEHRHRLTTDGLAHVKSEFSGEF